MFIDTVDSIAPELAEPVIAVVANPLTGVSTFINGKAAITPPRNSC